ncbi:MAG: hypothetical protein H6739_12065 [Alphaproteobacteria bacterium]|nr:hypothetical protein [Alphaproteobacteria bacterium]
MDSTKAPVTPTSARRAGWLGRAALLLVSTAVALAAVEGFARLTGPDGATFRVAGVQAEGMDQLIEPDDALLWRLVPLSEATVRSAEYRVHVRINGLGLRGPELGPPAPGEQRLLLLGDSFTLAAQVEEDESYAARLGAALSERLGRPIVTLNAGVDGYGTRQAVQRGQQVLERTPAQGAVLFFFLGNDLWENARLDERAASRQETAGADHRAAEGRKKDGNPLHLWLARRSQAYAWAATVMARYAGISEAQAARYREELQVFTDDALIEAWIPDTRAALLGFRDLCRQRRMTCAIAAIPPAFVVYPRRADATFSAFGLDPAALDPARPLQALRSAAPGELPVVDLTPALAEAADGPPLYFTFDGHLTPAGHAVVAEAVAEALAPRMGGGP